VGAEGHRDLGALTPEGMVAEARKAMGCQATGYDPADPPVASFVGGVRVPSGRHPGREGV
jgi:hypothetical protein